MLRITRPAHGGYAAFEFIYTATTIYYSRFMRRHHEIS
jgi:predicted membrane-bound mannosyltransferase